MSATANIADAYNNWAQQYDTNENRTRDLEAMSLRSLLETIPFQRCLEIGCGTGKNTAWLLEKAAHITAVDLSEQMLAKAKEKITHHHVQFVQANILDPWEFATEPYDLVTFSLVLEHIEYLQPIIAKAAAALAPGGHLYIGELHPFKQYSGSKARFETATGTEVVTCYNHHVSDFVQTAQHNGLQLVQLQEFFDNDDRSGLPRILGMLFKRPTTTDQ